MVLDLWQGPLTEALLDAFDGGPAALVRAELGVGEAPADLGSEVGWRDGGRAVHLVAVA
jgi:hypothetical protein